MAACFSISLLRDVVDVFQVHLEIAMHASRAFPSWSYTDAVHPRSLWRLGVARCSSTFATHLLSPCVAALRANACFIARHMSLTGILWSRQCAPPFPRPVPYPKITGFFWTMLLSKTLPAAHTSACCPIRWRISGSRCSPWWTKYRNDIRYWRTSRETWIVSCYLHTGRCQTLYSMRSLRWLDSQCRTLYHANRRDGIVWVYISWMMSSCRRMLFR